MPATDPSTGARPVSGDAAPKIAFMKQAEAMPHPLDEASIRLDPKLRDALDWVAARSAEEVRDHREAITREVEGRGAALWTQGDVQTWFSGSDAEIARLARRQRPFGSAAGGRD